MELQLGLALSLNSTCTDYNFYSSKSPGSKRKRSFESAFQPMIKTSDQVMISPTTLPLLSWNHNQPNEDEDEDEKHSSTDHQGYGDEEEGLMVGWPPIKSWRKKNQRLLGSGSVVHRIRSSKYVKVKMEGVAIARKIDLTLYNSLAPLLTTLLTMFGTVREEDDDQYCNKYVITYQDKEGDWLLANDDDVPWRLFVESAQRLKLQRNLFE